MRQEYVDKLDPTDFIISSMKRQATSQLSKKLHEVFNDIFKGDELDFLIAAIEGTREIAKTAPPETTFIELVAMWADKRLRVLN